MVTDNIELALSRVLSGTEGTGGRTKDTVARTRAHARTEPCARAADRTTSTREGSLRSLGRSEVRPSAPPRPVDRTEQRKAGMEDGEKEAPVWPSGLERRFRERIAAGWIPRQAFLSPKTVRCGRRLCCHADFRAEGRRALDRRAVGGSAAGRRARAAGVRRAGVRLAGRGGEGPRISELGGAVGRRADVPECAGAESGRLECAGPLRGARRSGVGRTAEHPTGERCAGDRTTGRKPPTGVRSALDAERASSTQGGPRDLPTARRTAGPHPGASAPQHTAVPLSARARRVPRARLPPSPTFFVF